MTQNTRITQWTKNPSLINWIQDIKKLCNPTRVHLCDGSQEEYDLLMKKMVNDGKAIPLNPTLRPNSFLFRSSPEDVARVEESTFICSKNQEDTGPTNNWREPEKMKTYLQSLFSGCMQGRTMYVIPFSMGPVGSPMSHIGVEITDSPYVVCNMRIMTRMGKDVLKALGKDKPFVPCLHSVGVPLKKGEKDALWPCNPPKRAIVHFPEEKSIWSFGSGYGGNALLGKKCFALRIASVLAKEQGWLAEHMLILGITNPQGEKKYIAAAFPSACGKTNLAMLSPALPGWKVECVGDDIAWMRFGKDGRLYAMNPEAGFFGVAPGTSLKTNPHAMMSLSKNTIFTNVGITEEKDVWWEAMSSPPINLTTWLGENFSSEKKAAHANSRFTAPASQCPIIDPQWQHPEGVPISAILFGGRRENVIPLVFQSFDWNHGVFLGASVSSQMTAAAQGTIGKLRHDPFAMLPFCGYHMGQYFSHWVNMGKNQDSQKLPKIFYVNWFQKQNDQFIWPGYGDNIRVLQWVFDRTSEKVSAVKTPIGYLPEKKDLNLSNLSLQEEHLEKLLSVDRGLWKEEAQELENYFTLFGDKFPIELKEQLTNLKQRLG